VARIDEQHHGNSIREENFPCSHYARRLEGALFRIFVIGEEDRAASHLQYQRSDFDDKKMSKQRLSIYKK